jgi:hypothetical protein
MKLFFPFTIGWKTLPPLATSLSKVFKFHTNKKNKKTSHMKQLPHTHVVQCNKMFHAKIVTYILKKLTKYVSLVYMWHIYKWKKGSSVKIKKTSILHLNIWPLEAYILEKINSYKFAIVLVAFIRILKCLECIMLKGKSWVAKYDFLL